MSGDVHRGRDAGNGRIRPTADELARALRARGMRLTAARTAILEAFVGSEGHVAAYELTAQVRARFPSVSASTVYRTLKVLVAAGLATLRHTVTGHAQFEPATTEHHDHMVCTGCGRVVEFVDDEIERLQVEMARALGFELVGHRLELHGFCSQCHAARAP